MSVRECINRYMRFDEKNFAFVNMPVGRASPSDTLSSLLSLPFLFFFSLSHKLDISSPSSLDVSFFLLENSYAFSTETFLSHIFGDTDGARPQEKVQCLFSPLLFSFFSAFSHLLSFLLFHSRGTIFGHPEKICERTSHVFGRHTPTSAKISQFLCLREMPYLVMSPSLLLFNPRPKVRIISHFTFSLFHFTPFSLSHPLPSLSSSLSV